MSPLADAFPIGVSSRSSCLCFHCFAFQCPELFLPPWNGRRGLTLFAEGPCIRGNVFSQRRCSYSLVRHLYQRNRTRRLHISPYRLLHFRIPSLPISSSFSS